MNAAGSDTAPPGKPPRDPVEDWLTALGAGTLTLDMARDRLVEVCSRDHEASWSVLSWLDQYHRRRVIDRDTYLDLKRCVTNVALPGSARAMAAMRAVPTNTAAAGGSAAATPQAAPALAARGIAAPAAPRVATPPKRRLEAGAVLADRYEIEAEIGRSALAIVFRARDRERRGIDGLRDLVAIKTLRDDLDARDGALELLRRECFRTQSLSHANIVNVYGWERDGDIRFMCLELVDGQSLEDLLADLGPRRLRHEHALAIVGAVGAALAHAHAQGVVHGDLKPANVMIATDGHVRVLGFANATPDPQDPPYELDGLRMVTPRYASPDVLQGLNAVASDDIYALGCIACELLCGVPPFPDGADARPTRRRSRLRKPRGVRRRDWPLLRKALAPERAKRPASVTEWTASLAENPKSEVPALRELVDRAARPPRYVALRWLGAAAALIAVLAVGFPTQRRALVEALTASPPAPAANEATGVTDAPDAALAPVDDGAATVGAPPALESPPAAADVPAPAVVSAPLVAARGAAAPESTSRVAADTRATAAAARPAASPTVASPPVVASPATPPPARVAPATTPPATTPPATTPPATTPSTTADLPPQRPERPFVAMVADTVGARESNGAVRVPVQRFGSLARAMEFTWWTEPGSAKPGADYADIDGGSARFAPGQSRVTLVVPLVDDATPEEAESFSVRIRVDRPGADPGFASSSVTILDDDSPAAATPEPPSN